jgi:S1-C subfamily serine protease
LRRGDVLLSLAGQEVGDPSSLASALAGRGGSTPVKLLRNGEPLDLHVDLKLPQ